MTGRLSLTQTGRNTAACDTGGGQAQVSMPGPGAKGGGRVSCYGVVMGEGLLSGPSKAEGPEL